MMIVSMLMRRGPKMNSFRSTLFTLILSLTAGVATQAWAADNADQILKNVEKKLHAQDESAHVKMTIGEPDGSSKERNLVISRLEQPDGQSVLVRIMNPVDLRGMGLLSVNNKNQTDQWLYLPSSKQTRRILSTKRSTNFLDSELSYEDMGNTTDTNITHKTLKTENVGSEPATVIESTITGNDSAYSKVLTWVSVKTNLVIKLEYYDRSGSLMKTTSMNDYKSFGNGIWRAQKVLVTNVQNKRTTRLELIDMKFNQGLSARNFSPTALANP